MGHPRSRNWTLDFEPAFSPRFSPTLSPRSIFQTRQRFLLLNHVTSGWMSPRSSFDYWSAVSHTGSSSGHVIALDQSGASIWAIRAHFTTQLPWFSCSKFLSFRAFSVVIRRSHQHHTVVKSWLESSLGQGKFFSSAIPFEYNFTKKRVSK